MSQPTMKDNNQIGKASSSSASNKPSLTSILSKCYTTASNEFEKFCTAWGFITRPLQIPDQLKSTTELNINGKRRRESLDNSNLTNFHLGNPNNSNAVYGRIIPDEHRFLRTSAAAATTTTTTSNSNQEQQSIPSNKRQKLILNNPETSTNNNLTTTSNNDTPFLTQSSSTNQDDNNPYINKSNTKVTLDKSPRPTSNAKEMQSTATSSSTVETTSTPKETAMNTMIHGYYDLDGLSGEDDRLARLEKEIQAIESSLIDLSSPPRTLSFPRRQQQSSPARGHSRIFVLSRTLHPDPDPIFSSPVSPTKDSTVSKKETTHYDLRTNIMPPTPSPRSLSKPTRTNATSANDISHKTTTSTNSTSILSTSTSILPTKSPRHVFVNNHKVLNSSPTVVYKPRKSFDYRTEHKNAMDIIITQIPKVKLRRTDMIRGPDGELKPNPVWKEIYDNGRWSRPL
ncbi:uncharacterized protein BX664DRAFT_343370 [Halteromyces radiatus]|uniref:uncharacterized protein n=1 Tax=Halteromyces radiatus TaxID=101107 RepID=UPI00221F9299|nr:uncharacterized protein BX664DRAFT_343370 [Halteromyces radiatus]KAI8077736.1 hypothetical protein BX664DRAFT_343370 [Halteromyces radiatus]